MLAQNFKTPAELRISQAQFDALVKTLGILERNETVWVSIDCVSHHNIEKIKFTGHFNMDVWQEPHKCGTVCCIGGTAELIGGVEFDPHKNYALWGLFYPNINLEYSKITVEQAACALRNYLTYGEAKWQEIVDG